MADNKTINKNIDKVTAWTEGLNSVRDSINLKEKSINEILNDDDYNILPEALKDSSIEDKIDWLMINLSNDKKSKLKSAIESNQANDDKQQKIDNYNLIADKSEELFSKMQDDIDSLEKNYIIEKEENEKKAQEINNDPDKVRMDELAKEDEELALEIKKYQDELEEINLDLEDDNVRSKKLLNARKDYIENILEELNIRKNVINNELYPLQKKFTKVLKECENIYETLSTVKATLDGSKKLYDEALIKYNGDISKTAEILNKNGISVEDRTINSEALAKEKENEKEKEKEKEDEDSRRGSNPAPAPVPAPAPKPENSLANILSPTKSNLNDIKEYAEKVGSLENDDEKKDAIVKELLGNNYTKFISAYQNINRREITSKEKDMLKKIVLNDNNIINKNVEDLEENGVEKIFSLLGDKENILNDKTLKYCLKGEFDRVNSKEVDQFGDIISKYYQLKKENKLSSDDIKFMTDNLENPSKMIFLKREAENVYENPLMLKINRCELGLSLLTGEVGKKNKAISKIMQTNIENSELNKSELEAKNKGNAPFKSSLSGSVYPPNDIKSHSTNKPQKSNVISK